MNIVIYCIYCSGFRRTTQSRTADGSEGLGSTLSRELRPAVSDVMSHSLFMTRMCGYHPYAVVAARCLCGCWFAFHSTFLSRAWRCLPVALTNVSFFVSHCRSSSPINSFSFFVLWLVASLSMLITQPNPLRVFFVRQNPTSHGRMELELFFRERVNKQVDKGAVSCTKNIESAYLLCSSILCLTNRLSWISNSSVRSSLHSPPLPEIILPHSKGLNVR